MISDSVKTQFLLGFREFSEYIYDWAIRKGWWEAECNDAEKIALMHSELSEALEACRHNDPPDDKIPEFTGMEAELADTVIRIMDFATHRRLRVAEAIIAKMEYNETRPHKHGGKKF